MDDDQSAARFMAVADEISKAAPVALGTTINVEVSATGAALIAAIHFGIGRDSRSLSNKLGIAHALVLREINALAGTLVTVTRRDARTQRTFVELTSDAETLAQSASQNCAMPSLSA